MKRYKVLFTPRAERQITELYSFIAEHGSEARAERFVGGLIDECSSLADFPERGTRRDDIRPNLRTFGYKRRVTIAFALMQDQVVIHGIYYGGQNFEDILAGNGEDRD